MLQFQKLEHDSTVIVSQLEKLEHDCFDTIQIAIRDVVYKAQKVSASVVVDDLNQSFVGLG